MKKSGKKAELKFFFKEKLRDPDVFLPILIFSITYLIKSLFFTHFAFTYDELAYSATAANLAENGGWLNLFNSEDLFFFPPLFNWLSGLLIICGIERVIAVRTVTMIFSSGIPVLIYILSRNFDLTPRRALIGPIFWTLMPGIIFFSTVGQVETPFLFFVLLSALFFQKEQTVKNLILSALFLSCGIWIKETAIGFAPAFFLVLALEKDFKKLLQWTGSFILLCSPLFIRSFLSHYGLFYELSNDIIIWGNIDVLSPFENILGLIGFSTFNPNLFLLVSILCLIAVIGVNIYVFFRESHRTTRFMVLSNLIFLIFFSVFPKQFDYYLLGVVLFTVILTVVAFSKQKIVMIVLAIFLTTLSVSGLEQRTEKWDTYLEVVKMLSKIAENDPGVTIGTPFPETVRYIAEKNQLDIKAANLPFTGPHKKICEQRKDKCITDYDYFLTDDLFFLVLFCRSWPIIKENCDLEAMKETILKLEKINDGKVFKLYRVTQPEEQTY